MNRLLALPLALSCLACPATPAKQAPAKSEAATEPAADPARPSDAPEFVLAPDGGEVVEIVAAEQARAAADKRTLIVYVGASWCEPCQYFHAALDEGTLDASLAGVRLLEFDMDRDGERTMDGFKRAISGNLCRCTGYNSINRAGEDLVTAVSDGGPFAWVWDAEDRIQALVEEELLPAYFTQMAKRLAAMSQAAPNGADAEFFVAGGTDLYVQRGEEIPHARVSILNHHPEMRGIRVEDGALRVGALTTFTEFAEHDAVRELIPRMDEFMWLIASLHIRNRATLGGNIVNASPIGDMTALLLALGSSVVLKQENTSREVALRDFFLGYKQLDKAPRELVTEIVFPCGTVDTHVNFEKVSKRKALDIATVCSGARIELRGDQIVSAFISMGGVAPIPLLLRRTAGFLAGRTLAPETVHAALAVAQSEVSPISDVRGSADYKRLLVNQLFIAHFTELFPDRVAFEQVLRQAHG